MLANNFAKIKVSAQRVLQRFTDILNIYDIFQANASKVLAKAGDEGDGYKSFSTVQLDSNWLEKIENDRPNYVRMANEYFTDAHTGFAILANDSIAAMGWLAESEDSRQKLLGYYPLPKECVWLHGDWTSPEWRGRGLHKLLIFERARNALADGTASDPILECNIKSSNVASVRNYERLGFEKVGRILVVSIPRFPVCAWRIIR